MTRQTNLDIIRAACVAANPEIQHRFIDVGNDGNRYAVEDSIRLADVLLAIGEKFPLTKTAPTNEYISINQWGTFTRAFDSGTSAIWDFRDDTLDAQSDATLSFLGGLLG